MSFLLLLARCVTVLWVMFWTYFTIASGLFTAPPGVQWLVASLLGCAWLGLTLAWRWPRVGGTLLLTEGVGLLFLVVTALRRSSGNDWSLFLIATMALPAITAGVLLLAGGPPKGHEFTTPAEAVSDSRF